MMNPKTRAATKTAAVAEQVEAAAPVGIRVRKRDKTSRHQTSRIWIVGSVFLLEDPGGFSV